MTWTEEVGSPTAMLACLWMNGWMVVMDFRFTLTETPQRNFEAQTTQPVHMLFALLLAPSRSLKIATAKHSLLASLFLILSLLYSCPKPTVSSTAIVSLPARSS